MLRRSTSGTAGPSSRPSTQKVAKVYAAVVTLAIVASADDELQMPATGEVFVKIPLEVLWKALFEIDAAADRIVLRTATAASAAAAVLRRRHLARCHTSTPL